MYLTWACYVAQNTSHNNKQLVIVHVDRDTEEMCPVVDTDGQALLTVKAHMGINWLLVMNGLHIARKHGLDVHQCGLGVCFPTVNCYVVLSYCW